MYYDLVGRTKFSAEFALETYIKNGESIRRDGNFENSPMSALERVIIDPITTIRNVLSASSVPQVLSSDHLSKFFVALVAPSLSGKTQSAFVLNSVKPLYFSFDTPINDKVQNIYKNFSSLSKCLMNCAEKDMERLLRLSPLPDQSSITTMTTTTSTDTVSGRNQPTIQIPEYRDSDLMFAHISASNLTSFYSRNKSFVLGFFMALIERSEREFEQSGQKWMKFHANQRDFHFSAKSMIEFKRFVGEGRDYCVFLDEFVGIPWAVLIRNLIRAAGMICIVANTNTNIANLVGVSQSVASRNEGGTNDYIVWSLIFSLLNYTSFQTTMCHSLQTASFDPLQIHHFERFFNYLMTSKIRPGILHYMINAIESGNKKDLFSNFLDYIIRKIGSDLRSKKSQIAKSIEGTSANLALFLNYAYHFKELDQKNMNPKTYLKDHLYFLKNPTNGSEFMFMTYAPEPKSRCLRIWKSKNNNTSQFYDWDKEHVYFDSEELITLLSCLCVKPATSVALTLNEAKRAAERVNFDVGNTDNPNSLKLDGNRLEVLATVGLLESSHHDHGSKFITFSGQDGVSFTKNLIANLINKGDPSENISLTFDSGFDFDFDIEYALEKTKIPFLYPSNCPVPAILQQLTLAGSIKVGSFLRTRNSAQIDMSFDFELYSVPAKAVAECKNWAKPVTFGEILKIIGKAMNDNHAMLSFIFCARISDTTQGTNLDPISTFSEINRINIFRIEKVDAHSFKMVPILDLVGNPNLICIIFETHVIDNETLIESTD